MTIRTLSHRRIVEEIGYEELPITIEPLSLPAKIAYWFFKRTRHRIFSKAKINTHRFVDVAVADVESMMREIMDMQSKRVASNNEIDRIVVGHDLYYQVMSHNMRTPFSMPIEMKARVDGDIRLLGFRVQFVPWIKGFAVTFVRK